jgi:hypothetical protein
MPHRPLSNRGGALAPAPHAGPVSAGAAASSQHEPQSRPELIARLYEQSLVPVREIARLAGITERNVYATARRLGCKPRMRTAPGGGRRVALDYAGEPPAVLDEQAVAEALAAWAAAAERQRAASSERLAVRKQKAAAWRLSRESEADVRRLVLLAQTMRDLKVVADKQTREAAEERRRKRTLDAKRQALAQKLDEWVRREEAKVGAAKDRPAQRLQPLVPVPDQVGDKLQRGTKSQSARRPDQQPLDSRLRGNERSVRVGRATRLPRIRSC